MFLCKPGYFDLLFPFSYYRIEKKNFYGEYPFWCRVIP